jgi:hypothetical protein
VADRKSVGEIFGECLREAAVLTAVFLPLDFIFANLPLTFLRILMIMTVSGSLLAGGIVLERKKS